MMRRVLAALAALLLATAGSAVILRYVGGAEDRAMAGLSPTEVLVVTAPVTEGTSAADLTESVEAQQLPAKAVATGAVTSLEEVRGLVTTAELQPGEQLITARFADPASLVDPTQVDVPAGMHEVSVLLEPQRVVGGRITAGDTVGAFVSLTGEEASTHLTLHQVLVTRVQGGVISPAPAEEPGDVAPASTSTAPETPAAETAPTGSVMVTLALEPADAEKLVFAAEHASIWLSREAADVPQEGTRTVTEGNVYE